MKFSLTITTLAALLLSTIVQSEKKTPSLRPRRGLKAGGSSGADNYFALISAAQEVTEECNASGLGNVVATVREDQFCIKLDYDGLSGPGLFSHVHGPAAVGETGPVIFTMDTSTQNTQCFELTKDQMQDLDNELWYFNIHSEMCPGGLRGQILPLVRNAYTIVKQLRQTAAEAVTEARV
jgi:hypothetical protein